MSSVPPSDGDASAAMSCAMSCAMSSGPPPVPCIAIAGREWPVPPLSPKQNRIVVPALLEIVPRILLLRGPADAALPPHDAAQPLDTPTYDRLTDIVYHALTRAHPELARADFDAMAIDTSELFAAIAVIARQAGLLKPAR